MLEIKSLINRALIKAGKEQRYIRRMRAYPTLTRFGCLPSTLSDVTIDESPWFCHSLAFRMATYPEFRDDCFSRWESLLCAPQNAAGWQAEYAHWNNAGDHWAKKWDRFHHFLWLLQCYEYFIRRGHKVTFPAEGNGPAPDLLVELAGPGRENIYVECFYYSKWWPREHFIEDVLQCLDPHLSIRRQHNITFSTNPFSAGQVDRFNEALACVAKMLTPERLAETSAKAQETSPQVICTFGEPGTEILFSGTGDYEPNINNAHGCPAQWLRTFIDEIVLAKQFRNNLNASRPNILLVNSLGIDFQLSLETFSQSDCSGLPGSIDELWISACGVDSELAKCSGVHKILRNGYTGVAL